MRIARIALPLLIVALVLAFWLTRSSAPDASVVMASRPVPPVDLPLNGAAEPEPAAQSIPEPAAESVLEPAAQPSPEPPRASQPALDPVPLEKLLGHKPEYRRPEPVLVLEAPEEPTPGAAPGAPSPVQVRHRSQEIGPMGPDRRKVGDAEVGVSVPVDDSVRLKGGVRVDYDQDPKKERTQIESTPTVGVEVRF
jgi:hypothetical protein